VSVLILAVFTLGVSLFVSSLSVYFHDVREMYQVAMVGLMYLTPIVYPREVVPEKYRWLIDANPMTPLLELLRAPIYNGRLPDEHTLLVSSISALVALVVGWQLFRRLSNGFYVRL
jgi:ABC-2 type transport system permease protein